MSTPILTTKLYIPPLQPKVVLRPRLIERLSRQSASLSEGRFARKLTLISAAAGFGKTTLLSEWIADCERFEPPVRVAWLSLDEGDSEPTRFLAYLLAALQTLETSIGEGMLSALQSPQPPSTESILTALLNDIATVPDNFVLVLDDYHSIDATSVDHALGFLLEHLPPQMHLVIASREDPHLPLARLRTRGQLTELRAADLRFTPAEAAEFLNQVMDLNLATEDIAALETRTEGWIAGLQLAAISMQGTEDITGFIESFTGSHHFVLDYLVEEVLHQQSEHIQTFLLRTSILDRLCGPLCDAILLDPSISGQVTLEYLEHANLFIVPLDNERRWYRYHHLFASFLRQRLQQSVISSSGEKRESVADLHIRASQWYEENGLALEAFHHAAAAHDIDRAVRLIESQGMPIHFRSAATTILDWLASLPKPVLDANPVLWVKSATVSLVAGQTTGVEEKLQAAEAALQAAGLVPPVLSEPEESAVESLDNTTRNLIGQIAAARATLAVTRYQAEIIIVQARRALTYLPPDNLTFRFTAMWTQGVAYHLMGDRAAAIRAYTEAVAISRTSGDGFSMTLAISGLGQVQELENQLYAAAENYQYVLKLYGDQPQPNAGDVHLGLARISYEWNDLEAAEHHGQQSLQLTRQYDRVIDRFILSEVFLARLKLARGDVAGAAAMLTQADQTARQQGFVHRMPEIAAVQVLVLLRQDKLAAAAHLTEQYTLPISQARVLLARRDPSAALAVLEPLRQQMETKGWQDERLKVMVLQAVALHVHGTKDKAMHILSEALEMAEPGGFIRIFLDEGPPMAHLLSEAVAQGIMPDYARKLLAAFDAEEHKNAGTSVQPAQPLLDPLSERELEVLRLIAQGLSNREICERLFLALPTVKGHNQKIFGKLDVKRRTEAVARARDLGLL